MEKTYTSFADYKALKEQIANEKDYNKRKEMETILRGMRIMPEVGMGATEILWSDCRAKTIVEVKTPNKIVVAENETKCLDFYSNDYEILDTFSNMPYETYTRRKSGRWVMLGQPDKYGSVYLTIGVRHHSIDPSF